MPKEWNGPSEYFAAAGLYGNQNRKAVFRSLLTPEGHARGFSPMDFEEAADLSISRKDKSSNYDHLDKKPYTSYGLDETMDLSTKWRAPPTSDHKPLNSAHADLLRPDHAHRSKSARHHSHHSLQRHRRRDHEQLVRSPKCPSPPLDVLVLSDEEQKPKLNGHLNNGYESDSDTSLDFPPLPAEINYTAEELQQKMSTLRVLRDTLRTEEMKLVLLKKLQQSQMKENIITQAAAAVAGKIVPPLGSGKSSQPPPLIRSSSSGSHMNKMQHGGNSSSSIMGGSMMANQSSHSGPPPLIGQRSNNISCLPPSSSSLMSSLIRNSHGSSSNRAPVTTPPNMVMGYNVHNLSQSSQSNQHSGPMGQQINHPQPCPSPSSAAQPPIERIENQTPAQRQAAAKLALRKQLEKTLLQIPPPKPPPPEMHFVPNANNQEFICLLGLEKAVDLLTEDPSINRPPPEPFECVQCGTDFSPVWKWQDAGRVRGKPSVICETCVTSNIKKALKAEHTNRLKTAFVKALQQEQEIEQRMAQGSPPVVGISPTHTPCSTPTPAVPPLTRSTATPPAPSHSPVHSLPKLGSTSLLQHIPKLSAAHQSMLAAQHFGQLPQPAHMFPYGPLLAAQAFNAATAYQLQQLGKGHMSSAELQRQYLLDMIPPRSLPQGSINWKT